MSRPEVDEDLVGELMGPDPGGEPIVDPPGMKAAPPLPTEQGIPEDARDPLAGLTFEEKQKLKENLRAQRATLAQQIAILEEETKEIDGLEYMRMLRARVDRLHEVIRPIFQMGEISSPGAAKEAFDEVYQWIGFGQTILAASQEEEAGSTPSSSSDPS